MRGLSITLPLGLHSLRINVSRGIRYLTRSITYPEIRLQLNIHKYRHMKSRLEHEINNTLV